MPVTSTTSHVALDSLAGRLTMGGSHGPTAHAHDLNATLDAMDTVILWEPRPLPHRDEILEELTTRGVNDPHARDVALIYEGMKYARTNLAPVKPVPPPQVVPPNVGQLDGE